MAAERIVVDELIKWPTKIACFRHGSCHLTVEPDDAGQYDLDRLHAFAKAIGMSRLWFQDHKLMPHYDLTPSRRALALVKGAVFVPAREQALRRRAVRRAEGRTTPRQGSEDSLRAAPPTFADDFFTNFIK